jgi:Na+/H+-translocating membrane pyrophosphatase
MFLPLSLASLGLICSIIGISIIKILASRKGSDETNIAN